METCLFYFFNFSWKRGKRAWLQTGKSRSHFECAQLMSVWCAMASQCSFQVRWPFHVWMWALLLLILCVRTSHAGGVCVCARFMTYLLLFFLSPFLLHQSQVSLLLFTITIDHRRWSLLGGNAPPARLLLAAFVSFDVSWRNRGWVDGVAGNSRAIFLSLSLYQALSFIRHPSLPPPRVPHFVVPFLPSTALQMSLVFLSSVYFLLLQQCCRCTLG